MSAQENAQRRQFRCGSEKCYGRSWYDVPNARSICFKCEGCGEIVPEGEEVVSLRQFQCLQCDGRMWYCRAKRSVCHKCEAFGDIIPVGQESEYRQFVCRNASCTDCGRRWEAMAERSECFICGKYGEKVPTGEEIGVFICKFRCDCTKQDCECAAEPKQFRVQCKMQNTAPCYKCRHDKCNVKPYGFLSLHFGIKKTTDNVHNCNECNGSGNCPNMAVERGKCEFVCDNADCKERGRIWRDSKGKESKCFICGGVGRQRHCEPDK